MWKDVDSLAAWFSTIPLFLVALTLFFVPGLPIAWALRLRGTFLVSGSLAASLSAVAIASLVAPWLGIPWSLVPLAIIVVVIFGVALLIRKWIPVPKELPPLSSRARTNVVLGHLIPFVLIGWTLTRSIHDPSAISQNYDSPFHVNAVHYIGQSGNASPFALDFTSHVGRSSFYPTLWHALAALLTQIFDISAVVATNVLSVVVAAVIWPIAILFLVRILFPAHSHVVLFAGVLVPLFASFPYRFLTWGLLYPNLLSTAILPIVLGFMLAAMQYGRKFPEVPLASAWIGSLGSIGAAVLAHPNALFAAALFLGFPIIATLIVSFKRNRRLRFRVLSLAALAGFISLLASMWIFTATSDNSRSYGLAPWLALKEGLVTSPLASTDMWFVGALVVSGIVISLRVGKDRWLLFGYLTVLVLFVVSMGPDSLIRTALTEPWYNDAHRIAALIPIAGIPLATLAIQYVYAFIIRSENSSDSRHRNMQVWTAAALCGTMLTVFLGQLYPAVKADIHTNFTLDENSDFVTPDERQLYEMIPDLIAENAVIASNPWNGSAYVFTLSNRALLFPYFKGDFAPEALSFVENFETSPEETCSFLREWGVTHFIGSDHTNYMGQEEEFSGLDDLDKSPILTEVERVNGAALYTVSGCD